MNLLARDAWNLVRESVNAYGGVYLSSCHKECKGTTNDQFSLELCRTFGSPLTNSRTVSHWESEREHWSGGTLSRH